MTFWNFVNYILDFIYPPRCIFCDRIIEFHKKRWICASCERNLNFVKENCCLNCRSVTDGYIFCDKCAKGKPYKNGYALLFYDEITKGAIYRFKYRGHAEYSNWFGQKMGEFIKMHNKEDIDFIVPVPIHYKKKRKRGFNQAELLAKKVSEVSGIPILTDVLIRTKNTKPQSGVHLKNRYKNLEAAFCVRNSELIRNKNIIIVDDIYTSGSTISHCTNELVKNGAGRVYFFTLSIVSHKKRD